MPAVSPSPRVMLRTTSRRVPRSHTAAHTDGPSATDAEPNMRLSRAILVMLLLHIVAVGGILAFSLIKERGQTHPAADPRTGALEAEDSGVPAAKPESGATQGRGESGGSHPNSNVHVVRPGETLTRIANETGVSEAALRAANGGATLPDNLRPGQQLKVPGPPAATPSAADEAARKVENGHAAPAGAATPAATPARTNLPADSGKTYVVGKGETPYAIAEKLKVPEAALLKLNGIDDPRKLKPGQKLHIPAASKGK